MKKFFYIIIIILGFNDLLATESKIIYKIQNEIITNIDIKNEYKYLLALNNELQNLSKDKIYNISKESIIRETVKKNEILKRFKSLEIDENFLDTVIKNLYLKKLKLSSREDFKIYLKKYDLKIEDLEKKIKIDLLWNELIVKKYNSQIEIDVESIKKEINNSELLITKKYLLSEIVFKIASNTELNIKYKEIKNSIGENGFENTVLIYSIADSSKVGGNIGWINESSLNRKIRENIESLNVGDLSEPILIPNGALILKINDIKQENKKIDIELELKKTIEYKRNILLNQYSQIYFNKIKKNLLFNE
jgi:peptidyl-prolyl cis-trans isomerase SurA